MASTPHAIFTPEHEALRQSVRRFVDAEVRPHVDAWEREGCFPDTLFARCGELGFLGLHYPERWGGSGGDLAAGIVHHKHSTKRCDDHLNRQQICARPAPPI